MDRLSPKASISTHTSTMIREEPKTKIQKLRLRPKKLLKPSVIRRICKIPKTRLRKCSKNAVAKVVYTNSQFGEVPIPCRESGCTSCSLAPPQRLPLAKSRQLSKTKPQCTECKAMKQSSLMRKPTEAEEHIKREHHCICTEFNGQLYKLMDEPEDFGNLSSLLLGIRQQHGRMPRLATKRNVVKRLGGNGKR